MHSVPSPPVGPGISAPAPRNSATAAAIAVRVAAIPGPLMIALAVPTFGYSASTSTASVGRVLMLGGYLVTAISFMVAGPLVLVWLNRARSVAGSLNPAPHRLSPGWTVGGWFIPIGNLWLPMVAVTDVVRASDPANANDKPGLPRSALEPRVQAWWAAWIGSGFCAWLGWFAMPVIVSGDLGRLALGRAVLGLFLILSTALLITAGLLLASIMARVSQWQNERLSLGTPGPTWADPTQPGTPGPTWSDPTQPGTPGSTWTGPPSPSMAPPGTTSFDIVQSTTVPDKKVSPTEDSGPSAPRSPDQPDQPASIQASSAGQPDTSFAAGGGTPTSPKPSPSPERVRWLLTLFGLGAAILVTVVTLVYANLDDTPAELAEEALEDLREWEGITYRGTVKAGQLTATVSRDGDLKGVWTSPSGGHAEFAIVRQTELIKADRVWWQANYNRNAADQLANVWVRDPVPDVGHIIGHNNVLSPAELTAEINRWTTSLASEYAEQTIDGTPGRTIGSSAMQMVITRDSSPQLLAVRMSPREQPLRVYRADSAALAEVRAMTITMHTAPSYTTKRNERPRIVLSIRPPSLCLTPTCTADVRLTNLGEAAGSGYFDVRLNGQVAGSFPYSVGPFGTVNYSATVANPFANRPGTRATVIWQAVIRPD